MAESILLKQLSVKNVDKEELAIEVVSRPELLPDVLEGLRSDQASIKYGSDKILRIISEQRPEILYPHFDLFVTFLDSENNFLKWGALSIVANLTAVDSDNKFEDALGKYFSPIQGPALVAACNIIKGAAKIALAKPALTKRISTELLSIENGKYKTSECRNIALGQVIESISCFFDQIDDKEPVIRFINKQLTNTRAATNKKAEKFIRKHKIQDS